MVNSALNTTGIESGHRDTMKFALFNLALVSSTYFFPAEVVEQISKVFFDFSMIFPFLELVLVEQLKEIRSLESKLFFISICSIKTRS